jgi:hypothetical protein
MDAKKITGNIVYCVTGFNIDPAIFTNQDTACGFILKSQ